MIAELEDKNREIDFDEFLDAITNKLGNQSILLSLLLFIHSIIINYTIIHS